MRALILATAATTLVTGCHRGEPLPERQLLASAAGLEIYDAYAPAPAAPDVGSLYFTVVNVGSEPDTLVAVETSGGGMATLHEMIHESGAVRMQATGPMVIPASDSLRLRPGGYHVMLSGLSYRPAVGDTLAVVITFTRSGAIEISAPVLTYTEVVRLLGDPGGSEH